MDDCPWHLPLVLAPALALDAPVVLRHLPQPPAYLRGEGAGREAPPPVAARPRGNVHAGLAAEAEDVLQREDRQLGHRSQQRADEVPVDLPPVAVHVAPCELALR